MWKNIKIIAALTVIAVLAALFLAMWSNHIPPAPPRWDMVALLQSNAELKVTSLKFYNPITPSLNVSSTNFETLTYATKALRNATENFISGWSCRALLTLSNGKAYDIDLTIAEDGKLLSVGFERGWLEDEKHYSIKLADPVPKELTAALVKMTTPMHLQPTQKEDK